MSNKSSSVVGAAVAGVLLLGAVPAIAQESAGRSEVSVHAGALFGDDLTRDPVSGTTPKLDDDLLVGLRYAYNFNQNFALEGSFGYNPNKVTDVSGGDIDLELYTLDVNAVWNLPTGTKLTPYVTAGVGYAFANLDHTIVGTSGGQAVSIDDEDGFTANAGVGLKYDFTDRVYGRVDVRYRYIDTLLDKADAHLNGAEATVGVGYRF
jgi:OmpA-OmpF porin, OOP family